jgi:alginate O-acetyltransferase complex protein AlgI
LWHGNTPSFAIWGLGHGVLLTTHQAYRQNVIGKLSSKRRKALLASPLYRMAATTLTFVCVTVLWTFFRFPLPHALRMFGRLLALG